MGRPQKRPHLLGLALCTPLTAVAHMPSSGLGPVYDGALHLILSPEDLIPLIALALLCGQLGASSARRIFWVMPLAWTAGGAAGMFAPVLHLGVIACVPFLVFGGLVALNVKVPLTWLTALGALFGAVHGYLNGNGVRFSDGAYALLGISATVSVVVALLASLIIPMRQPWMRIAVRVVGSWVAASGVLLLGWTLRGNV